jgi:hypothetical protein
VVDVKCGLGCFRLEAPGAHGRPFLGCFGRQEQAIAQSTQHHSRTVGEERCTPIDVLAAFTAEGSGSSLTHGCDGSACRPPSGSGLCRRGMLKAHHIKPSQLRCSL